MHMHPVYVTCCPPKLCVCFDWEDESFSHRLLHVLVMFVEVERTKDRPIACGEISRLKAFVFLGLPLSASLAILLTLNSNTSVYH